jgi:hypothetical protein
MNFCVFRTVCTPLLVLLALFASRSPVVAADVPPGILRLLELADTVVVSTVERVEPQWQENDRGDRLIVSKTMVQSLEALKGELAMPVWIDVEGGTLDGVTLRVSSAPLLETGERAVLFLRRQSDGRFALVEGGIGVLKLDARDLVRGTTISLADIRLAAQGGRP